jgi:hypothetical protein
LNDIIIRNIDRYQSFNETTHENNGKNNENIHPCTTRPPNTNANNFHELFDKDVCKLMNECFISLGKTTKGLSFWIKWPCMCNRYPTCYKSNVDASKKFCKYGFPQTLVDKTH